MTARYRKVTSRPQLPSGAVRHQRKRPRLDFSYRQYALQFEPRALRVSVA